jgi:hypothetical protein
MAILRQTAVQALASIGSTEALQLLKTHMYVEHDEKVRTSLFQAMHSLQTSLGPGIETAIQYKEFFPGTGSL